jgi:putative redox protein
MTIALYARRKEWPLEGVTIRLQHSRIHATDCAECDERDVMLDRIESEIALSGPLSEAQRGRLLEIAERCPVHRTLTSAVSIRTRLASG